jgi:uncharacterized protein (TIGR03000 family)
MRKLYTSALVVLLSGAGFLLTPGSAEAQRGGVRVRTPNFSLNVGNSRGYYDRGYYDRGYYGRGYDRGYYGNYYAPYRYAPYRYSSSPYYYSYPRSTYYDSYPTYSYQYSPSSYQSNYPATTSRDTSVLVKVHVPDPNAEIWFEGSKTSQHGTVREFQSPPLDPGRQYTYTVRARWMENGREVDRSRAVQVQGGQQVHVDFTKQ